MKKALFIILPLTLLTGCKSLDYVRSQDPVLTGSTEKPVSDFGSCVSAKWSGSGGQVTSLPLSQGISIQVPQAMGGYDVVLDVTSKAAGGSDFVLYERVPSLTSDSYENAVSSCK